MNGARRAALRALVAASAELPSLAAKYAAVDLGPGFRFDRVPVMTRAEATTAAGEAYRRRQPGHRPAQLFTSGGTTGEPHLAWIPADLHLDDIAAVWQPFRADDTVANLAMPGRLWSAHLFYSRLAERAGAGVIGLGHVEDAELETWADFLSAQGTTVLVGTPGQLAALLRFAAVRQHPLAAAVRAGVWFGEPCGPELDQLRRDHGLEIELYGNYGSTETWVIGHNGPTCASDCFHVLDHQHVEVTSDGTVLVTSLHPGGLGPVIRYRLGDRGSWRACRCGRGTAVRVLGRAPDLVKFAGTLVDPYELVRRAGTAPDVRAAQALVLESAPGYAEVLELRIVADPAVDPRRLRDHVLATHIDLRFGLRGSEEEAMPVRSVERLERSGRTAKTPAVLRRPAPDRRSA